jgi:Family of unknown function (DUF5678)
MSQLTFEQIAGVVQGMPLLDRRRLLNLLLSQPDLAVEQKGEEQVTASIQDHLAQHAPNLRWLEEHREEYIGQWVALHDGRLIAHSSDGEALVEPVRKSGVRNPLIVFVEPPGAELFVGF